MELITPISLFTPSLLPLLIIILFLNEDRLLEITFAFLYEKFKLLNESNPVFISFFFGFVLDLYSDSIGINAAACLSIAFLRSYILSFVFGSFYDPRGVKLIKNYVTESTFSQKFLYLSSIIIIHHLIIFSLETFSFNFISLVIYKTLITFSISLIFCTTFIYIMIENEK
ncbi:rod shape-determining protein MreD [Flavobacteriaceae bacterium]|nr:rod shape-determining protein MreD [Flavobacteriaceae bacterium]